MQFNSVVIVYHIVSHWIEVRVDPLLNNSPSLLLCYCPLTYLRSPDCTQMTVLQVSDALEANLGGGGLIPPPSFSPPLLSCPTMCCCLSLRRSGTVLPVTGQSLLLSNAVSANSK